MNNFYCQQILLLCTINISTTISSSFRFQQELVKKLIKNKNHIIAKVHLVLYNIHSILKKSCARKICSHYNKIKILFCFHTSNPSKPEASGL